MSRILWTPTPERADASTMAGFERFLRDTRGLTFADYNAMWRWSVDGSRRLLGRDLGILRRPRERALHPHPRGAQDARRAVVSGCHAQLHRPDPASTRKAGRMHPALIVPVRDIRAQRAQLGRTCAVQVASVAAHLRGMGVQQGDRVAAILPNTRHGPDGLSRDREPRGGLVDLRARYGACRHPRPLPADRAEGADRAGRLCARAARRSTAARCWPRSARPCPAWRIS